METLRNQVVVVVGGTSGIGAAAARAAVAAGARVAVIGRDAARLAAWRAEHTAGWAAAADVRDAPALQTALAGVAQRLGRVDHVYLSAGTIVPQPVVGGDEALLRVPFEERVFGALNVVRAAVPHMGGQGSLTFTTGDLVDRPVAGLAAVGAAAAAVESLCKTLALELAPIRCNVVSPGAADTPLLTKVFGAEARDAALAAQAQRLPRKRVGTADEVAQVVLLAMANAYLNGTVLHVDGGMRLT